MMNIDCREHPDFATMDKWRIVATGTAACTPLLRYAIPASVLRLAVVARGLAATNRKPSAMRCACLEA